MVFYSDSPEQTERIGEKLASVLHPGDVVAYYGGLGMGKTALTRGVARGLGVRETVTSPTYTIVNEYESGRMPLFHFDMYRLGSADELFDIGWEDYLARGGVCCVEWSENVDEAFEQPIRVEFARGDRGDNSRVITITGGTNLADFSV
jgi:tRNA threonylcarbamoyladenosine biosynthesis protein TsaE